MRSCFAFLLLLATAASAQSPSGISGKVVDARGGQPLARCVVAINSTTQRATSLSVTTGDDGRFAFPGLAVGKYHLSASHRGYLNQAYQEHGDFSTAIAVGPGLQSENLIFNLTPQAIVYGTITDEAGGAIRSALVKLYADREPGGVRTTTLRQTATTNDLGKYEIAEIPPGNYYLSVSAQPWYAHALGARTFSNPPDAEAAEESQDSALNVAYPMTFYNNATSSDEATPIPLRGGERLEINLTLNPQQALRLRLPVPSTEGASFTLDLTQSVFGQLERVQTGMQVQGGVLEVDGVLPGQYDVTLNQFGGEQSGGARRFTAEVGAGATNFIDTEAVADVTVAGKVNGLDEKTTDGGITLFSARPLRNYFAQIDKAGEFSMKVPPGDYEVIGQLRQMYLARVTSANAVVHGRMVEVKAGAAPVLEIAVGKGFGQVDGFVTSGRQRPGGVLVLLAPEDAKDNQILFRRDQSDSDGSFTLYGVIPGRYRLMAIEQGWDLEWSDPNVLRAFAKKSIPILVHEGEKLQQSVEMQGK